MNDSYVVREAGMSDVAAIAELQAWYAANSCASWRSESPSAAELEHKFFSRGKAPWVVAEEGGTVAGFAYVSRFRDSAGWADTVENSVYVRPGWEGRGIGKALMRHLIRAARDAGYAVIVALVSGEPGTDLGLASVALHRSLGFSECGRMTRCGKKFGRIMDCIFLELHLQEESSVK